MSLEESVNEVCAKLTSVRATDRKKSAEALKEFLSRNAVPSLLTANTLKANGLTWNNLFDDINNFILKETEKVETSKNFANVTAPLCKSLLHLCIAGSNNGKAFVKCDKITNACLNILHDRRLAPVIGDAYLTLLYRYVFPVDYYLGCISSSTWEDILDVCLSAGLSNTSELDNLIKIRLLLHVVKGSTSCCQFIIPLRDSLSKFKKYFNKVATDKKVQEFIVEIMILLIETITPESLLTICEFTESMLAMIVKFYEQYLDQRRKSLLFKLFKVSMDLYHRLNTSNATAVGDISAWNKYLNGVLEITCSEMNLMQRTKSPSESTLINCKHFHYVAASAHLQVFAISDSSCEDMPSNSAKKLRVSINKNKSFEDLIQELHYNPMSWVGVVQTYVDRYGDTVSSADYVSLIRTAEHILASGNRSFDWDAFGRLVCAAVTRVAAADSTNRHDNNHVNILALWNICLRNVAVSNEAHKSIHSIIQTILKLNMFNYSIVQPLLVLYFEKAIPVTDDSSRTLNIVLNKFYNKCCYLDVRMKLLNWLTHKNMYNLEDAVVEDTLLRLLCVENINLDGNENTHRDTDTYTLLKSCYNLYDINLNRTDETINVNSVIESLEMRIEINVVIIEFFEETLSRHIEELEQKAVKLTEFVEMVKLVLVYFNILLKNKLKTSEEVKLCSLFALLQKCLRHLYSYLKEVLKGDMLIKDKVTFLKCIQGMLIKEYDGMLNAEIRGAIEADCFHAINDVMKTERFDDEDTCDDDLDVSFHGLKQNCIYVLAAYCRTKSVYSDELAACVLDKDLYNFDIAWDIECALKCVNILIDPKVQESPMDLIFELIRNMCKESFRNAKATFGLLQIISNMIDKLWRRGHMQRQNSIIMVKSYLHRCSKSWYPPHVAALAYECAAKIITLNAKADEDLDSSLRRMLTDAIKGDTHTVRLHCCYLLQYVARDFTDDEVDNFKDDIKEIFVINVSEQKDTILKDENSNRTLAVLYSFYVLGLTKKVLMNKILVTVLMLQAEASMDKRLVKEMLDKLTHNVRKTSIEMYLNTNIVYVLYHWFNRNKTLESIPFHAFGLADLKMFIEKHMRWLIPTETLWHCGGDLDMSDSYKYVCTRSKRPKEDVIESCFCNVIVLCLPYIVVNKYKLDDQRQTRYEVSKGANRLFQDTRRLLKDEKWSALFEESLGEVLSLSAAHTRDRNAHALFDLRTVQTEDTYTFSKDVFQAILKYFGELIDGDMMQVICESQPSVLFRILIKLWSAVDSETVFDLKIGSFHTFLIFVESIPLGHVSDALLFNYACSSVVHALKTCDDATPANVFSKGLIIILKKIKSHSPRDSEFLRKSLLSEMFSVISMKRDLGVAACVPLLTYLRTDFSCYFAGDGDVVDYVSLVQNGIGNESQSFMNQFVKKLKTYVTTLSSASHEVLSSMAKFLKLNRNFAKQHSMELNMKGFSEECCSSVLHRAVSALCHILKHSDNDRVLVAACDCLAEMCSYDLKTLVTVSPMDTNEIIAMPPKLYLSKQVLTVLSTMLLDADSTVSRRVADAIIRLLAFRDGKAALDICAVNKKIVESLSPSSCETSAKYKIESGKFEECNGVVGYWVPSRGETHGEWISRVTMTLFDLLESPSNYINALRTVCAVKPSVCGEILPALIGQILECVSTAQAHLIGEKINHVFKYVWDMSFEESLDSNDDSNNSRAASVIDHQLKLIIHSLLGVVNFVRIQEVNYSTRVNKPDVLLNYLDLDYNVVSWAATAADEHLAAVYYGELWASAQLGGVPPASPRATTALRAGRYVQKIFRRCFRCIGEVDAMDGCDVAHLTCEQEKRRHLISSGQFSEALLVHDIALSRAPERDLQLGAAVSLHRSGLHYLALQYIRSLPENEDLNNIKYDCLSYLGDWSDFVDTRVLHEESKKMDIKPKNVIKAMRYACLKDCLTIPSSKKLDMKLVQPLTRAKLAVARLCKKLNMENCQNVYRVVGTLHLLRDIEDYSAVRCEQSAVADLVNTWGVHMLPTFNDFKYMEPIISQRTLVLEHAATNYPAHVAEINALQLQYAELGLSNQRIHMAQRSVSAMKQVEGSDKVTLLESQISWAKGHRDIALSLLNGILTKQSDDVKWTAMAYRQYGLWMAESKRDNARDIIEVYLNKSLELLRHSRDSGARLAVYYDVAKFADEEYKQIVNYMNSSTFEDKVKCMERMKGTAATLKSSQQLLSRDEKKAYITNNAFKELDEAEIANTRAEKETFLNLAIRYYLMSLVQSEENNLSVFRVISLWFENQGVDLSGAHAERTVGELIGAVPSWKFVTVLPQLAPRLTTKSDQFSEHLGNLILRCAKEHPHHTLPILFSLKNSDKDMKMRAAGAGERAGPSTAAKGAGEERCRSAAALVERVGAASSPHHALVAQMERVCDAMISFAYCEPKSKSVKPQPIPSAEPISRLRDMDALPVPTDTIAVRKDCDYSKVSYLTAFDSHFELVGGINYPKKIACYSSDGKKRILLIKGEDDLRQDAVMQQVFNIVNTLLEENQITYRSKLLIRTYKVVPMSRRAGVLEWVAGTMPLGQYLLSAHTQYRPQDITPSAARAKMKDCHETRKSNNYKQKVFKEILKVFRPVFHHFFTENYLDPVTWYERRLAYTRSVATSSMVGYVLGLGDRHVQNILVDRTTAELVHIDFGIAFDQGKTLPTPETVPFRLTQDIVAGFGCSGVEGVFRRSCEKTLQLLRDNQETLLTILEVLLCDPLYLWSVSTNKSPGAAGVGGGSSGSGALAARALLAVGGKLRGADGHAGGVAVPGQVAGLVRAATDPANLCRLFPGWQPYL